MLDKKITIIDDESDILEFVSYNLQKEGYKVEAFANPVIGLQAIILDLPDLVITDWIMPDMEGLELCRRIKQNPRTNHIPVVMVSCKNDEIDVVTALEVGADDYMIKPFKVKELAVRIKKIMNRNKIATESLLHNNKNGGTNFQNNITINFNGLLINKQNHEVFLGDQKIDLTFSEFKILELLADKPGHVYTRFQILQYSFGQDYLVTERTVDVKIVALRKKLGKHENLIKTVRSVGYKFDLLNNKVEVVL